MKGMRGWTGNYYPICSGLMPARRQGVFEGVCSNSPFGLQKIFYKCPTVEKWSTSSLAAIANHRKNKSGCSYACLRTSVECTRKCCDKKMRINACVNKSLFQGSGVHQLSCCFKCQP